MLSDDSPPIFSANSDDKNVSLDYGTTESDVRHLLSFDYVYQIPAVRGLPRWLGEGWQINGADGNARRPSDQRRVRVRPFAGEPVHLAGRFHSRSEPQAKSGCYSRSSTQHRRIHGAHPQDESAM